MDSFKLFFKIDKLLLEFLQFAAKLSYLLFKAGQLFVLVPQFKRGRLDSRRCFPFFEVNFSGE